MKMDYNFIDISDIKQENFIDSTYLVGSAMCGESIDSFSQILDVQVPTISNSNPNLRNEFESAIECHVCYDKASGKHYGAVSCDGCKGFFRRTIRNNQVYVCSGIRNCPINKTKRNKCRYCRLQKCYKAGMKTEAVQETRDKIAYRSKEIQERVNWTELNIHTLKNTANSVQLIPSIPKDYGNTKILFPKAKSEHIFIAVIDQLKRLVAWLKILPEYQFLDQYDQMMLLKSHISEHLVMGVAYRSAILIDDIILLCNNTTLERGSYSDGNVISDLLKELVVQFKFYHVDDDEYLLLKAIKLFNPEIKNLNQRAAVRQLQRKLLIALEDHISEKPFDNRGRIGELLLLLSSIISTSKEMTTILSKCEDKLFNYCESILKKK